MNPGNDAKKIAKEVEKYGLNVGYSYTVITTIFSI